MTLPDDERRRTPRDRFRNILSADKADGPSPETRKPPVVNLPRIGDVDEAVNEKSPPPWQAPASKPGSALARLLPGFWTVGTILSLTVNVILLVIMSSVLRNISSQVTPRGGDGAIAGLYNSLEQMDQAHIRATIPVQTNIALDVPIPLQTSTNITLASDVLVDGAHVKISTGLIDIDAPASVTLPAGTSLAVALDLILPLQTSVPISVEVPVDIAVMDTDLHAAIISLQDVIRPVVCASNPNAVRLDGSPVCR